MPRTFKLHLPFQVHAFRGGAWQFVSQHHTEELARRQMKKISRCQPNDRDFFRVVTRPSPDFFHD